MTVPRRSLAKGYDISPIIIGGWQLSAGHTDHRIDYPELRTALHTLVDRGFTTFDCADIYTGVEEFFGDFRSSLDSATAQSIQIHTKFVPDRDALTSLTKVQAENIIDRSLARLKCDRLDLVQFAWWDYEAPGWLEAAGFLVELQQTGKIRHLGVTNFNTGCVRQMLGAGIQIVSNQLQYSVLDRRPERGTTELCLHNGVGLLCYGTLAGGFLTDRYLGRHAPEPPFENRSLTKYRLMIDEYGGWAEFQKLLKILRSVADRHSTTIASVAVRCALEWKAVTSAIVGTRSGRHVENLAEILTFAFDEEDAGHIAEWAAGKSGPPGDVFDVERDRDGKHGRIMKYNLNRDD